MSETPKPPSAATPDTVDEASGLTDAQRDTLRSLLDKNRHQLVAQRQTSAAQAADSTRTGGRERDEELHALEDAEINEELQEHAKQEIELIDAALKRLELGSYGVCCDCANAIGFARLEAYPMARRCITCKTAYEQRQ